MAITNGGNCFPATCNRMATPSGNHDTRQAVNIRLSRRRSSGVTAARRFIDSETIASVTSAKASGTSMAFTSDTTMSIADVAMNFSYEAKLV